MRAKPHTLTALCILAIWQALPASHAEGKVLCPEMPNGIHHDVQVETEGKVAALGKLGEAEFKNKVQVLAKSLFEKIPNGDRVVVTQMLASLFCQNLSDAASLSDSEKMDRIERFSNLVRSILVPGSSSLPPDILPRHPPLTSRTEDHVKVVSRHSKIDTHIEKRLCALIGSDDFSGWSHFVRLRVTAQFRNMQQKMKS